MIVIGADTHKRNHALAAVNSGTGVVVDELLQVSARLVVNRAAYRLKVEELLPLLEKLG